MAGTRDVLNRVAKVIGKPLVFDIVDRLNRAVCVVRWMIDCIIYMGCFYNKVRFNIVGYSCGAVYAYRNRLGFVKTVNDAL